MARAPSHGIATLPLTMLGHSDCAALRGRLPDWVGCSCGHVAVFSSSRCGSRRLPALLWLIVAVRRPNMPSRRLMVHAMVAGLMTQGVQFWGSTGLWRTVCRPV